MSAGFKYPAEFGSFRQRLLHVVEQAAPPFERSEASVFVPAGHADEARSDRQYEAWRGAVAAGDEGRFDEYLLRQGLTAEEFRRTLGPVTLRDRNELPTWGRALMDLMQGAAAAEASAAAAGGTLPPGASLPDPWQAFFSPFLDAAGEWLQATTSQLPLEVTPPALEAMVAVFARRLRSCTASLLQYESRLAAAMPSALGGSGAASAAASDAQMLEWLGRLESFPALGYVVGVTYRNWQTCIASICSRLSADLPLLRDGLFGGKTVTRLCGFDGDLGDLHNHGQSVAILTFENGRKAVYKPKNLPVATGFNELISFLNRRGLQPDLLARVILLRDGYAWEEFAEHQPCTSVEQVRRFYMRMGMTIRLLQFLEGRDFWLDNLIACGEHPVFIDLEMLLQPRVRATGLLPAEQEVRARLAESVVETCAITMLTPIDIGIPVEDLGALAAPKPYLAPFRRDLTAGNAKRKSPPRIEDFVTWRHDEHAPVLDGKPADAADYLDEIVVGYRRMQDLLAASAAELEADSGPLSALRDVPIRFIYRDTWACQKLIQRSVMPAALADTTSREISMHQLLESAADQADAPSADQYRRIIESEIAALRELDVPFFTCRPDSRAVFTQEGTAIEDYFNGTAWDRLRHRVHSLASFPTDDEIDILRSCFASGRSSVLPVPEAGLPRADGNRPWLEDALSIGEAILRDAAVGEDGSLAWLGFVYRPHIDQLSLEPLQTDLLTGSCGVAIFFADLFHATHDQRWRQAALGALKSTTKALSDAPENWAGLRASGGWSVPLYCGAFCGTGGEIFATSYCARVLDAPELLAPLQSCLAELPFDLLLEHATDDVITGRVGLLLGIIASVEAGGGDLAVSTAEALSTQILSTMSDRNRTAGPTYPSCARLIGDLPGMRSGCMAALARLAHLDGDPARKSASLAALDALEQTLLAEEALTTGDLIIALQSASQAGRDADQLTRRADQILGQAKPAARTRGLIQAADLALAAFDATSLESYHDAATGFAGTLRQRRNALGTWFPCSVAADRHNLSIVAGLPAVGRVLLGVDGLLPGGSIMSIVGPR